MNTVLKVEGMHCQNCARTVRETIEKVPDVKSVRVNLDKLEATVSWRSDHPSSVELLRNLDAVGFPAKILPSSATEKNEEVNSLWKLNVILGSAVTFPLMAMEWILGWGHETWFPWLSFVLVLPVQIFCGAKFYKGAWQQLKAGQSNMDTLVSLGSSVAFAFSVYGLLNPSAVHHTYFMESAAIITLISIGHWLESIVSSRAAQSVQKLLTLAPSKAFRLRADGVEEEVAVADLNPSDIVVLRPGNRIPVDGEIIEGSGAVDESMLTGESIPVEKKAGDRLYTGTTNMNGRFTCRIQAAGEATALSQIIEVVERSQNSRANIQRLADRISSVFVPVIILCALATLLVWGFAWGQWEKGLINAIAVLIVACPCAMGLATPAAIMAGANAGAKRGILIRDGVALEKTGVITSILFDKTGTLTEGKPAVKDAPLYLAPQAQVLSLVKALSEASHHPLSQSLALYAGNVEKVIVSNWREEQGSGVLAQFEGETLRLGSLAWLKSQLVDCSAAPLDLEGTLIGVSRSHTLLAVFALEDRAKKDAKEILERLRTLGLKTYMVSGDHASVANAMGKKLGFTLDEVFAETRPERKVDVIQSLQNQGEKVAFVGDGINDAPALTQADLGIAVSRANDIAKESADIVLLKADLSAVPDALGLSRRTLLTIKQNLFWAFFYNAVAVPIAASGFASPILCAAAMGFSDVFLVANSMRLLYSKKF